MTRSKTAIAMIALTVSFPAHITYADEPKFEVVVKRADDKVEVKTMDGTTTFSVRSPFGIGNAVIKRVEPNWPERVSLRLHLKGLEGLKVSNGKVELVAEVSGTDNKRYLQKSSEGKILNLTKPPVNEIQAVGSDGKPSRDVPLEGGYFEVRLPNDLFQDNPKSIRISWIDFYR